MEAELLEQEEFRFGIKQRLYNWSMRVAREKLGLTQKDLARLVGTYPVNISRMETFRWFPKRELASKVGEILHIDPLVLFPEWLKEFKLEQISPGLEDESVSLSEAVSLGYIRHDYLLGTVDQEVIEHEVDMHLLHERVKECLTRLPARERNVLELRFGLVDGSPKTMDQVGSRVGVTRERIHQIEAKALRMLRHPSRNRELRDFLE